MDMPTIQKIAYLKLIPIIKAATKPMAARKLRPLHSDPNKSQQ